MNVQIRKGIQADIPQVLNLVKELALYEKAPEQVITTTDQMIEDGFGTNPTYQFLVAVENNRVLGTAVYFIKYSTWKGKGIYLDDIVVQEKHRNKGIGKKLFEAVIAECKLQKCKQLHWQVLDWNTPAINFYKKYKAEFDKGWINCKIHF
ncbi:MAG TPA: GNAT family N-acetyltransferase [Bacteroidia bacterium]|nr:GNAT family N-acetyltransferase [Bacteroidia bacterium]HNU32090.1 GNAT family N-acetyltransferase [Bacteroidia bacterium]